MQASTPLFEDVHVSMREHQKMKIALKVGLKMSLYVLYKNMYWNKYAPNGSVLKKLQWLTKACPFFVVATHIQGQLLRQRKSTFLSSKL